MFADNLRKMSEEASHRLAVTASESFILFVKERATRVAKNGQRSFTINTTSLPWSENEMTASFPSLAEDGLKVDIDTVASHPMMEGSISALGYSSRPRELKVNW
jgi:hypothetical protein